MGGIHNTRVPHRKKNHPVVILKILTYKNIKVFFICVVCLTVCVPSPYSSIPSIRQSYVILIEFEWNGLKVSEVDSLENRKFLEESHLNL